MNLAILQKYTLVCVGARVCVCVFLISVCTVSFVVEDKLLTLLKVRQGREEWEKCSVGWDRRDQDEALVQTEAKTGGALLECVFRYTHTGRCKYTGTLYWLRLI